MQSDSFDKKETSSSKGQALEQKSNFKFSRFAKLAKLNPSKDELRDSFLAARFDPETDVRDFMKMKFRVNGGIVTGQTILRRFGTGKRDIQNFRNLVAWIGIISKYNVNVLDYSDPSVIKAILLNSKINIQTITFKEFLKQKIKTENFIGTGKDLIKNFQKALSDKLESGDRKYFTENQILSDLCKKVCISKNIYVPFKASFDAILNTIGVTNLNYCKIKHRPALLREILESSGIDFNNWDVSITEFYKMRFDSSKLREADPRNSGTISGQALAKRYFGTTALRNEHIRELLLAAGYTTRNKKDYSLLHDPYVIKEIFASCKQKIDLEKIKFKDFKTLCFNSKYFRGSGYTLLKRYRKPDSKTMREVLKQIGISNPIPARWIRRLK
ncbi:MAG: hypothetical protein N3G74_02620 [Candidatus Micrarchaeota archaeon]|nr:hypothetical protein [Candidatus Micrarchaeota archaeon]